MKFVPSWARSYDPLLIVLSAAIVALYVGLAGWGFPLDDSWIHQTYARNLATYGEWSFVPGIPSAASTAPLYTVLLAAGYALGIDYGLWTHMLGALSLALCGALAARLSERLVPDWRYIGLLTGTVTVLTWHLVWVAVSGMETALICALTLALIFAAWRELDGLSSTLRAVVLRGAVFGALAAVATSTRPEGVLLAGILGLAILIARPSGSWRSTFAWSAGAAIGFAIFIAPYLLLNLQLTGGPLPNTSAAKQAEYAPVLAARGFPRLLIDFFGAVIAGGQALLLPGIAAFALTHAGRLRVRQDGILYLAPLVWSAGLIALYAARLPMYSQHGRYVIPALPSLIVLGVAGTFFLFQALKPNRVAALAARVLMLTAAAIFAVFALVVGPAALRREVRVINEEMVAAAFWLRDNLPPERGLLAIHDIGAVGYFAPRPILDTAGLITPEVVHVIHDKEGLYAFLRDRGAAYFLGLPDQVPGRDLTDPRLCQIYTTGGTTSPALGGGNMSLYRLAWDGICD